MQRRQTDEPVFEAYWPDGHDKQAAVEVAPVPVLIVPAAHCMHWDAPSILEYVPDKQDVHVGTLGALLNWPARQGEQEPVPLARQLAEYPALQGTGQGSMMAGVYVSPL